MVSFNAKMKTWFSKSKNAMYLGLLLPLSLSAQEDSIKVHQLKKVDINAIQVSEESPFVHQNMDEQAIANKNFGKDIPFLLNATPSFASYSEAGAGVGGSGLRIRGTDMERINLTINGMPINDPESQSVYFVNFPDLLSSTNSLQIQRGVGSSTNGPAAFGASIHVNNAEQSLVPILEANNSWGSFNTWKNSVKMSSGLLKSGFQVDFRASRISSDGYIDRASSDLKSLHMITGWTSKNRKTNLKFNLITGKQKTYQAWNGISEEQLQENRRYNSVGIMEDGSFYDDQTDNYQQDFYQLLWNQKINQYLQLDVATFLIRGRGYYNEYRIKDKFSEYGMPNFTLTEGEELDRTNVLRQRWLDNYYYGLTYALKYHKDKTSLIFGGSLSEYDGDHYGYVKWAEYGIPVDHRWYLNTSTKKDLNTYLKWQQDWSKNWITFAELQYRLVDYEMNGFRRAPEENPHPQYHFVNPKLGVSYFHDYSNQAIGKAYFSFAMGNKEPNRKDFEESPVHWVNPEELYDFEWGYEYRHQKLFLSANFYYMYYKNQLVLSGKINDYGIYGRINVDESYRRGIELMGAYQVLDNLSLGGNMTLSQNHIINFEEYIDDYDEGGQLMFFHEKTNISFSPNMIAAANISYQPFVKFKNWKDLTLDAQFKYVGKQYLDNSSQEDRVLKAYQHVDLSLDYLLPIKWTKELRLNFTLYNALNTQYEANGYSYSYKTGGAIETANFYFPQAGRHFMLSLNVKF